MHFYGFQPDVLINFFVPLRQTEAIAWKSFGSTKEGSGFNGMKLSHIIARYNLRRIHNTAGI